MMVGERCRQPQRILLGVGCPLLLHTLRTNKNKAHAKAHFSLLLLFLLLPRGGRSRAKKKADCPTT